ncbi:MAG: response regulator containing a CheY-like receiver domain and an DNA-binding domain [Flavipsychrobacter sp.]|nr:response regulator containing a CheY-like receiver domain and an DNA-binding domain [Flavipsychrobacter sp.]
MTNSNDFVIIDDDAINNTLCRKIIEKTFPNAEIADFTDPQEGFDHIARKYANTTGDEKTILLLDISMPVMNAWEFLEGFEQLGGNIKDRVKVHILSSSVNKQDMLRAQANKYVEYYLIKPLTKESIRLIVHVLNKRLGVA